MRGVRIEKQVHGYRRGHQLLAGTVALARRDQDEVDRLSDLEGPLRPGELFKPYLTAYPVPSKGYYVLARTFQDVEAGRSGCVLTSSALIPMESWEAMDGVDYVLAELTRPDRQGVVVAGEVPTGGWRAPEAVERGRTPEIVDAVFGDGRPVVIFDCEESETIAVRLMLALWPAVRRQFSLCTFALDHEDLKADRSTWFSPRRVRGQGSLVVVIGALGARQRGQGSDRTRTGRSTRGPGGRRCGFFRRRTRVWRSGIRRGCSGGRGGDERTSLRILALWNELASRADGSPTAVLGMLDILGSRNRKGANVGLGDVESRIMDAIAAAGSDLAVEDAWEFLFALEGKVAGRPGAGAVTRRIETEAYELARRNAGSAVAAVAVDPGRRAAATHTIKGLGDAAAEWRELAGQIEGMAKLPRLAVAGLMTASVAFGARIIEGMNSGEVGWSDFFWRGFDGADEVAKSAMRRAVVGVVGGDVAGQTVLRVLEGAGREEVVELARLAVERRVGVSAAVNGALWHAAGVSGCQAAVRDAVMESGVEEAADRFVLPTLVLGRADIEWLGVRKGEKGRSGRLLRGLLERVEDGEVRALSGDLVAKVMGVLEGNLEGCKQEIVRILALDISRSEAALEAGFRALSILIDEDARRVLGEWLIRAGLSGARPADGRVIEVLAEFGAGLAAWDLVEAATYRGADGARLGANLVALGGSAASVRSGVLREVERLSERLIAGEAGDLGEEGYGAWALMIRDCAREGGSELQLRVARRVLGFALSEEGATVSELVVETFPIVYRGLGVAARQRRIGGWESLFASNYLWWMGVDEWEGSQKRAVRALVRAYMSSTWPPADVMVAALKARASKRVVREIRKRDVDGRYVGDIERDARRLKGRLRARVLKCLTMAR